MHNTPESGTRGKKGTPPQRSARDRSSSETVILGLHLDSLEISRSVGTTPPCAVTLPMHQLSCVHLSNGSHDGLPLCCITENDEKIEYYIPPAIPASSDEWSISSVEWGYNPRGSLMRFGSEYCSCTRLQRRSLSHGAHTPGKVCPKTQTQ